MILGVIHSRTWTQASEVAALIKVETLTLALSVKVGLHGEPLLFQPLLELSHVFQGLFCITDAHICTAPSSKAVVAHTAYIHTPVEKAVIESAGIVTKIVRAHQVMPKVSLACSQNKHTNTPKAMDRTYQHPCHGDANKHYGVRPICYGKQPLECNLKQPQHCPIY